MRIDRRARPATSRISQLEPPTRPGSAVREERFAGNRPGHALSNDDRTNRDALSNTRSDGLNRRAVLVTTVADVGGAIETTLVGLITRRSRVRISPPLLKKPW
jgi:hypothetical protein